VKALLFYSPGTLTFTHGREAVIEDIAESGKLRKALKAAVDDNKLCQSS
jgi:hypothetical protein